MRSEQEIKRIVDTIYGDAVTSLNRVAEVRQGAMADFHPASVDELLSVSSDVLSAVDAVVNACTCDGVILPKHILRVSVAGESVDTVIVSTKSKLKADYKYRKDVEVAVTPNLVVDMGKGVLDALVEMLYIDMARENMDGLNELLTKIFDENEIGLRFKFVIDHTSEADVLEITDDMVVFNADICKAHQVSSCGLMYGAEDDGYAAIIRQEATDNMLNALKSAQTTAQIVKSGIDIIKSLTSLPSRRRVSKILRKSYHRQAKYLGAVKSGIGYYNETVKIDGEEVEVFSLVNKDENGDMSVCLTPFSVETLFNIDYDVLGAVAEQTA